MQPSPLTFMAAGTTASITTESIGTATKTMFIRKVIVLGDRMDKAVADAVQGLR